MKITVYSTTTCPYCVMLKSWLQSKSVEFTDYMVDKNPIAAEHMVNLSGQMGVPFSTVEYDDGTVEKILGFDRPRFEAALATKK
jgi:glutaredoxin 3